jgi:hypothetical protein
MPLQGFLFEEMSVLILSWGRNISVLDYYDFKDYELAIEIRGTRGEIVGVGLRVTAKPLGEDGSPDILEG